MRATAPFAAALVLALGTLPAAAQEAVFIAFGDSVTEGYGDTSTLQDGYPGRLQRWLRQAGYDATVINEGLGGETTAEGLSRLDGVLDQGGDYLLLMEGTNDISSRIGIETITNHLNQMAARAEEAGMVAVHASVIPRIPEAPVDSSNFRTSALAASIRDLGDLHGRAVADVFSLFEALPDVFNNYYYYSEEPDPVGHPNSAGYTELAGLMLETVLALLETPNLQVVAPASPLIAGTVVAFQAVADEEFSRLEWDFGDGGWATSSEPLDLEVEHVFLAPGTYTVILRGETTAGGQAVDQVDVQVTGSAATWAFRTSLIPVALRGDGSETTDLVTDLRLQNFGAHWMDVEVLLVPEISYDLSPPSRRLMVGPGTALVVPDVVGALFGLTRARGALLLTGRVEPGGSTSSLAAVATLSLADAGAFSSDTVDEVPSNGWSPVQKVIGGIAGSASTAIELAVANVDTQGGYVQLDLIDAQGTPVDSALFEMGPAEIRFRALTDLFRGLESRPQPFTAVFRASGAKFVASAVTISPATGQVVYLHGSP